MLSLSYASEDRKWRWRVAFLFILAHTIVFILPFFAVTFLLMEILGPGQRDTVRKPADQAFGECSMLIILIGIFFSEMLTMFVKPFSSLVVGEVIFLGAYVLSSHISSSNELFHLKNINDISHTHVPLLIITVCTCVKIGCAFWSQFMEQTKKTLLKRGPGKIV